jgi:tRNA-splicing ligase RtcB
MIELQGKYNKAIVYTDNIDDQTISQVIELCNQSFVSDSQIRIMPDTHAGAGCVIGTTLTVKDKIVSNLVGVDIGCGMHVTTIAKNNPIDLNKLDATIREYVPSGFSVRNIVHRYSYKSDIEDLFCVDNVNLNRAVLSIGTLGGGNHFIEVDEDNDFYYLVIHSGSRNLGKQVADYYQNLAIDYHKNLYKDRKNDVIEQFKREQRYQEMEDRLKLVKKSPPDDLCYLEGELFTRYIHDMQICQEFATLNRLAMAEEILTRMNLEYLDHFTTIHNYIDTKEMILRKGAVSAKLGERLIIPINMRDGSIIAEGKGNSGWNFSAPHGAGRILARGQAKRQLKLEDFQNSMEGIFTTCVGINTIDESPMAYKSMDEIIQNTVETIEIKSIIKPIYNFKASEDNRK